MIVLDELDRPDEGGRRVAILGGRRAGLLAYQRALLDAFDRLSAAAERTSEAIVLAAPVFAEVAKLSRAPGGETVNPAKLARSERRRQRPGR